ncbi:MAG TPA: hypothetical protein VF278_08935 [Pirellulales bacterium]
MMRDARLDWLGGSSRDRGQRSCMADWRSSGCGAVSNDERHPPRLAGRGYRRTQQAVAQQTCNPFFAAALFSAGGCCPPGKTADVYVSAPAAPLEVARICACPCDCASGGNPPPSSPPGFNPAPPYHKPVHDARLVAVWFAV